jgi:hypothetical protein
LSERRQRRHEGIDMKAMAFALAALAAVGMGRAADAAFFAADPGDTFSITDGDGVVMTQITPRFAPFSQSFFFTYVGPGATPPDGNASNLVLQVGINVLTTIEDMVVTILDGATEVSSTTIPVGALNVPLATIAGFTAGTEYEVRVTGLSTTIGGGAYSVGVAFGRVVPLPAAALLMLTGLGALGVGYHVRKRRAPTA